MLLLTKRERVSPSRIPRDTRVLGAVRDLLIDRLVGSWWPIYIPGGALSIGDG
jgi:hypothetical protein